MKFKKVRKKPVEVEALDITSEIWRELIKKGYYKLSKDKNIYYWANMENATIVTLEGEMEVNVGDYIIKGVQGEFYPCKRKIFNETYDILSKD